MSNNQGTSSEIINLYRDVNADIQGPFHEAVMNPPPLVKISLIVRSLKDTRCIVYVHEAENGWCKSEEDADVITLPMGVFSGSRSKVTSPSSSLSSSSQKFHQIYYDHPRQIVRTIEINVD